MNQFITREDAGGSRLNSLVERGGVYNFWNIYSTASGLAHWFATVRRRKRVTWVVAYATFCGGNTPTSCLWTGSQNSWIVTKSLPCLGHTTGWDLTLAPPSFLEKSVCLATRLFLRPHGCYCSWISSKQLKYMFHPNVAWKTKLDSHSCSLPGLPCFFLCSNLFLYGVVPNILLKRSIFFYQKPGNFFVVVVRLCNPRKYYVNSASIPRLKTVTSKASWDKTEKWHLDERYLLFPALSWWHVQGSDTCLPPHSEMVVFSYTFTRLQHGSRCHVPKLDNIKALT